MNTKLVRVFCQVIRQKAGYWRVMEYHLSRLSIHEWIKTSEHRVNLSITTYRQTDVAGQKLRTQTCNKNLFGMGPYSHQQHKNQKAEKSRGPKWIWTLQRTDHGEGGIRTRGARFYEAGFPQTCVDISACFAVWIVETWNTWNTSKHTDWTLFVWTSGLINKK